MAKLKWDQEGQRLYETGVEQGVLYVKGTSGYETGVAWNGLISVEESPSGADETALYADDRKYLSLRSKEEYGATITAYTYPDAWAACDGSAELATGLMAGQQPRKGFGLVYKTLIGNDQDGENHGYKIHIVYDCTASVSSQSHQTVNDSPEAVEFSWEIKSTPVNVEVTGKDVKQTCTLVVDSTKFPPGTSGEMNAKLKALEDALFGTDSGGTGGTGTDPTLPTPAEIAALLA